MRHWRADLRLLRDNKREFIPNLHEIWYKFETDLCKIMSKTKTSDSPRPVRRFIRRRLDMRLHILTQPDGGEVVHGRCITISEGGFGAILTQTLPPQHEIWVQFRSANLGEESPLRAEIRQAKGFHYGFQFISPDSTERSFIRRLVALGTDLRQ